MMKNDIGYMVGILLFQIIIYIIAFIPNYIIEDQIKLHIIVILNCGIVGTTIIALVRKINKK